jgi:hypothetical protein
MIRSCVLAGFIGLEVSWVRWEDTETEMHGLEDVRGYYRMIYSHVAVGQVC